MKLIQTFLHRYSNAPKRAIRAIAFVDYEHWYYSYQNLYGIRPNLSSWRKELEETYQLLDIMVFGDFTHSPINQELNKIRETTNTIIETWHSGSKKDMTDFIMVDYLYQTAFQQNGPDSYILFTGDGHFQPVTKFITQQQKKEVVIYGVRGAFSSQLKASASRSIEYPYPNDLTRRYYEMIIQNFDYVSDKNINPTFLKTVEAVAEHNHVSQEAIHAALQEMVDKGYAYQREVPVAFNRKIKIICADWDRLCEDGLWDPDTA